MDEGIAANHFKWRTYKRNAKVAKREFTLTFEQFHALISKPCTYCGSPPVKHKTIGRYNGICPTNGVDRIDNSKGYTVDNCVSCCKICNHAKNDMSVDEFAAWLERVFNNLLE
jgi:5-methylcytosine-specific restriction endonuclease McrA